VVVENEGDETTSYMPCYIRLLLKQIEKISVEDMEAEIQGTLIFTFNFNGIPEDLIKRFTGKEEKDPAIMLEFNKEDSILLKEGKGISMKQRGTLIEFIIRQKFKLHLTGHVFLTPFEKLHMDLSVTAQSVHIKEERPREGGRGPQIFKHIFKFNCMEPIKLENDRRPFYTIRHGRNITFGQYRIISNEMTSEYTN
jgi:hypothetical protein